MGNEREASGPRVRGSAFHDTLAVARERLGDDRFAEMVTGLPPEFQQALDLNNIQANVWYPIAWELALDGSYARVAGGGRETLEQLGYEAAMRSFSGLYRIFFKLLQPQTLFAKAGKIFAQFYSEGDFELFEARSGYARTRFVSPGFDANVWMSTLGACRAALEVCGAKEVALSFEKGGGDGDDEAIISGTWKT